MYTKKGSIFKQLCSLMIVAVMTVTCVSLVSPVYGASYPYDTLSERSSVNKKMYDTAADKHRSTTVLNRYKDKSLKDMYETKETGMTSDQRATIKKKADAIVSARAKELGKTSLTQYEKVRAFHDWIIEHFYYYADVNKISSNCDNPYYLLTSEYNNNVKGGKEKIRSRCNGYSATLIAFARSQGIPARSVAGYYVSGARKTPSSSSWAKKSTLKVNHHWTQVYVNSKWIVIDCNADCWNSYSSSAGFVNGGNYQGQTYYDVREAYFDVSAKRLAQSHIILEYRPGSKDVKYLSNTYEAKKLKAFLNTKYSGKTNGKRINSKYSSSKPETWFPSSTSSKGDGNGNLYKLYWPSSKSLYGKLDLSGFTKLQNVQVLKNKLTSLYLKNCPSLTTVSASGNKIKYIDTRGSKKLTLLSVQGNPTVSVAYTFNKNKTAIIKSSYGKMGTVSVKYSKSNGKHKHTMTAFAKSGYKFKGWYKGSIKVSSKAQLVSTKSTSFTYVAKFVKR